MELEREIIGGKQNILLITPKARFIDATVASSFRNQLMNYIKAGQERIVLDLSPVEGIDSSGLGVLITVHKALDNKSYFRIFGASSHILNLFELVGMKKFFNFYSCKEEALKFGD